MSGNLSVAPALVFALALLCPALPGRGELPLPPASEGKPSIGKPGALPDSLATWNLQWFPGNRPKPTEEARQKHEKSVAEILPRLGVDLLVLEEIVDRKACERATSGYSWKVISDFQRAADEDPELPVQNIGIFSKVPIRESWETGFHSLPVTSDRPVRGFLGARLGTKKNGWTVYAVHLKSNRGGREASAKRRERAMDYLRKDWNKRGLDPAKDAILIAGDFNCSLRNPEFAGEKTIRELLREGWVSASADLPWPEAATVRPDPGGKYPAADFDHILLSPGWLSKTGEGGWKAGVLQDSNVPSDHYPVWLRWRETRK